MRDVPGPGAADQYRPSPELTTALIESSAAARRLRLAYRMGAADREMEVDPWAVVLRHSRWYLLCWPDWYARQLARIPAPFAVLGSAELRRATSALSRRLQRAAGARADEPAAPDRRNA